MFNSHGKKFDKMVAMEIVNTSHHLKEFEFCCLKFHEEQQWIINKNLHDWINQFDNIKYSDDNKIINEHIFNLLSIFPCKTWLIILRLVASRMKDETEIIEKDIIKQEDLIDVYNKVIIFAQWKLSKKQYSVKYSNKIYDAIINNIHRLEQMIIELNKNIITMFMNIDYTKKIMMDILEY